MEVSDVKVYEQQEIIINHIKNGSVYHAKRMLDRLIEELERTRTCLNCNIPLKYNISILECQHKKYWSAQNNVCGIHEFNEEVL